LKKLAVVILAAGQGKRMNNPEVSKALVELKNKPLIAYVLDACNNLDIDHISVVVGYKKESVMEFVKQYPLSAELDFAFQEVQLGTGHAVDSTRENLKDFDGDILVLCADVPLINYNNLQIFIRLHQESGSNITVLSMIPENPAGYGRIIRDENKDFVAIKEHKDATEAEKLISEVNSGVIIADSKMLYEALGNLENNNAQGEYYLTDAVEYIHRKYGKAYAFIAPNFKELTGINNPGDLDEATLLLDELQK